MCDLIHEGKADVGSHRGGFRQMFQCQCQGDLFRHFGYPAPLNGAGKGRECHQCGERWSDEAKAGVGVV